MWKGDIIIRTEKMECKSHNDITYLGKELIADMIMSDKKISKIALSTDTNFSISTTDLVDKEFFNITNYTVFYSNVLNIQIETNQISYVNKDVKCIALYTNDGELVTVAPIDISITSGNNFYLFYKISISI